MAKNNPILIRNEMEENAVIRHDLIFVVVMNAAFMAILLGLFFFNRSSGRVDAFFAHLLKF